MEGFIGFLVFMIIFLSGFWMLLFLASFIPYWIFGATVETIKDKFSKQ